MTTVIARDLTAPMQRSGPHLSACQSESFGHLLASPK